MKQRNISKLALILAIILFCVSCGKKDVTDVIVKMFDEGIEQVQKAESVEEVQNTFDKTIASVEEYKSNHLKEISSIDSLVPQINEAQHLFTKACCIKAFSFNNGYIKNEKGVTIAVNSKGEIVPLEDMEGDVGLLSNTYGEESSITNPLGITRIVPKFKHYKSEYSKEYHWLFEHLTLQNSAGTIKYNDEDAEKYYGLYIQLFFMACKICDYPTDDSEIINYLEDHFTEIIRDLPLDDKYPEKIREYVNERYYDNKDAMNSVSISERGYGYIKCSYYSYSRYYSRSYELHFSIRRNEDLNGALSIYENY